MDRSHHPDHAAEIVSLNDDDLQIEELEQRLELALLDPAFGCNNNICSTNSGDCTTNRCSDNTCNTHSGRCTLNNCTKDLCTTFKFPIEPPPKPR